LVPVMNFCERDQLDGLALGKQMVQNTSAYWSSHSLAQESSVAPYCL
jgi:hypothetical protein